MLFSQQQKDCSEFTLHIKYPDPPLFADLGYNAEYDSITFGNIEELLKYVNGKAAYDILDDSVLKHENEILLYAENDKGEVVWGTKEEVQIEKENTLFSDERLDERGSMDAQLPNTIRRRGR